MNKRLGSNNVKSSKKELLIQQQKEQLELETELAQAAAEERTYISSEIGKT